MIIHPLTFYSQTTFDLLISLLTSAHIKLIQVDFFTAIPISDTSTKTLIASLYLPSLQSFSMFSE
ncbi:hypothetical protein Hanom_Chr09g00797821 [Helianthus anomalus]